ncbi:D-serine deaminase-like pyridoxal phosphate-dependent protein [Nocardioides zeae]|uniref:D-serine deaminase-like pyridoxal phosphate-dependent protein n=2 Tax=Nocardioides zeae TaxID=1457234 RepID=A0ACC6II61_9ACTN|nr:alanine racemase [Nocardioides zeae]MDQ1104091.1 D-serine deaminase-like pyridoxal phosphate-dependent protein [Nocardioides zeae]MDR6176218.1 D-serine deaminase-like pyridoxal phosphate-dependent protein [Nocardioides zeae]MDR6210364.1 D-serine deaminase-like pyridoxal phosphate-dependent protein [Nocardioides zeae]
MTGSPATPYLAVDGARLDANVRRVQAAADRAGVRLRPHVKTHKVPAIAQRQLDAGAVGVTVATVGEAEVFVEHGCTDVLVAYPVFLDEARVRRVLDLAERARVVIGVDSVDGARRAAPLAGAVGVAVEVDSGHRRSGVDPEGAGAVALAAADLGVAVEGVFTFPGHGYAPGVAAEVAAQEAAALAEAAAVVVAAGIPCPVRSGGSTPTLEATLVRSEAPPVVDELRPGVYVFGDAQQWELGHHAPEDIALVAVATVVSHAGGRAVLDAGSKTLGADRAAYASGFGRLLDHPGARIVQLSEHHAVVDLAGAALPAVGERVRVVPNHVCAAVNLADTLVVDGEQVAVAARGRNS